MAETLRALLVEDSEDDAVLLVRELRRGGYHIEFERVETAEELAEALDRGEWDIVLADYTMPRFAGTAALEVVRKRVPDLPFIFVSGTIGEDVAVEAMKTGADDYVIKGNLKRLIPAVARELRGAAARRERRRIEMERRAAEAALRLSEERHRLLFEHIADGILVLDPAGVIGFASSSVREVLGRGAEELVGRAVIDLVHPDDAERAAGTFRQVMGGHDSLATLELRMMHHDGSWRTIETVLRNLVHRPEIGGIVATCRDVTERKRLEAEFLQAQKLESVGRLAGGVAHDFNNLLTAVLGYADELLAEPGLGAKRAADIAEIRRAAERATALTRQLLAFSRRQVLDLRPLDLNSIIGGVEQMLRRMIGEDIELVTTLEPELGTIRADAGQIEQVLFNLAVNARDAMPGGGRLLIETANVDVPADPGGLPLRPAGRYILLAVTDNGMGMDAEVQAQIFDPFFTTKPPGTGTGLGLATVYGIVKQCEGHISVRSAVGQGARFEIYLPRVDEASERLERPVRTAPPARGSETVLVVEDDAAVRALVVRVLRRHGYSVLEGERAEDVLDSLARTDQTIHLLITDAVLPGMSGRELAEKAASLRPGMPILLMSGYAPGVREGQGAIAARTDLIEKPFTPAELAAKVRELLDAR